MKFNKNKVKSDGLQHHCKPCQHAYTKRHYEKTKTVYIKRAKDRVAALRVWYKEYKSTLTCNRCSENHISCIQFHHKDPNEKDLPLCQAVGNGWTVERLKAEIDKCEVLCANCHFKLHYEE